MALMWKLTSTGLDGSFQMNENLHDPYVVEHQLFCVYTEQLSLPLTKV
jgi:hypothetical protein